MLVKSDAIWALHTNCVEYMNRTLFTIHGSLSSGREWCPRRGRRENVQQSANASKVIHASLHDVHLRTPRRCHPAPQPPRCTSRCTYARVRDQHACRKNTSHTLKGVLRYAFARAYFCMGSRNSCGWPWQSSPYSRYRTAGVRCRDTSSLSLSLSLSIPLFSLYHVLLLSLSLSLSVFISLSIRSDK